ncbi:MAG: hypothetical protein EBV34_14540 [Betaproteobacteria bacterium]|nr:hypothetical protein [Betaproteobacteria bacterium]
MSKEQILDAIASMTVLELADLIKMIEEKFGVSAAAAAVAVAAPSAAAAAPAVPSSMGFWVLLSSWFVKHLYELFFRTFCLTRLSASAQRKVRIFMPDATKGIVHGLFVY